MMHITNEMIHPELRSTARMVRLLMPSFTPRKLRLAKAMTERMRGRHSKDLNYDQKYIERPDGSKLRICVYSSLAPGIQVPGLLWIHGGGYAIGAPEQDEEKFRQFIAESNCVIVAPDYILSPDKPYPAALEDCYLALLWLKTHGREYGMRDDQIMVGGGSAGGGLTAALTLYARDRKEVAVAFQMPLYPMIDDRMDSNSAKDNDAPLWNSTSNDAAWRLYLGDLFGSADVPVYAAPARATDLSGLPPTCTFVGSIEPFHDETVNYMNRLRECGIPVHFKVYDGCFHAFETACGKTKIAEDAKKFLMDSFKYAVKNYFAVQPSNLT